MNQKAFYVATHPDRFRFGEAAEIVGVRILAPKGQEPRPCFHLRFKDGKENFVPVSDSDAFRMILSKRDMKVQGARF